MFSFYTLLQSPMCLTDLYDHRGLVSTKVHDLIFVINKNVVWELSEHYRMCGAKQRSINSSHYFPYPFTGGKITWFLITTAQKLYIKSDLFIVWVLVNTFFNCCLLDDSIIKAFLVVFSLFTAGFVLVLFYIPQIYLSRILSDWFGFFFFFPPEKLKDAVYKQNIDQQNKRL